MSPFSRKPKARFSLPSTPARRDSIENLGLQIPSIPPASLDPYTLVRASTPSDEDYGHIGAFKLGSLRIMNGSPAVSPAVDSPLPLPTNQAAYFAGLKAAKDYFQEQAHTIKVASVDAIAQPDGHQTKQNPKYLSPLVTSPRALRRQGMMMPSAAIPPQIMPAIHVSPLAIQDLVEDSLGLQTTSKHTAVEDDLFEEEHTEYSPNEYLDVRVDLNAKSLPPRPRLISEGRGPRGVMRSDSGLTATPVSEHSQGLLAKSDSGYSSNVSLRSFSAKPPLLEACETSAEVYDVPLQTPAKDAFVTDVRRPTVTTGLVEPYESQQDGSIPPPQPEKSLAACEAVPREYPPVPEKDAKSQASSSSVTSDKSPLSPMSSNTSGSWASIGTGSRKLGKLERLLRSAPKPTSTFQVTSPSQIAHDSKRSEDQGDSVSLWPGPLASRPEPSKANLKATVRVGGVEFQEDVPPVPSLPKIVAIAAGNPRQDLATDPDISFQPTELVTPIRTPSTRKPIARKPLPIRKDSLEVTQLCKKSSQSHRHLQSEVVQPTSASFSEEYCHQSLVAAVMSHELMATSNKSVTQAIQDVTPAELQYFRPAYIDGTENSTLFAPDAAEQMRKSRSPPPVSMRTRKTGSVRATPPARPQSTPPVDNRDLGVSNLPRRPSRERIYSYPLGQPMLSKRSSREDVHSYPPARAVYENLDQHVTSQHFAAMDRRRSVSTKTEDVEHLTPTRDVQTDHGQTYRGTSIANSRRNSLVAQSSQNNSRHPQPVACAQQQEATRLKALRRQSSYDGYSYQHARAVTDSSYEQHMSQGNGPYPFIANASGDTQISDPWSGLPPQQSPNIQSRYPPNIPRGHTRNQSSGSHSDAAPFRVLHSYDSPAYRNAPIWG